METAISSLSMALGVFIAVFPAQAAKIWGANRFEKLAPERLAAFLLWYRVFGFLLFSAGALTVISSNVFSD